MTMPATPDIWRYIIDPAAAPAGADAVALKDSAASLASIVSPMLAEWLLFGDGGDAMGVCFEREATEKSRLMARFKLAQQTRWAARLTEQGFDIVFMKGFANAFTLYPDPVLRMQGDLDLLVREADLPALVDYLAGQDFTFRPMPVKPWGMISDASFFPFVSEDSGCDIDVHILPDCYPAHRSLTTERLFAASRVIDAGGADIRIPGAEHALLLCITNAAKDKFGVFALRKVIDAMRLLDAPAAPDLELVARLAAEGGYLGPANVFFRLIEGLGYSVPELPAALAKELSGVRAAEFNRALADFRALFPVEPDLASLLWREWTLCAEPAVALHNLGLRFRGLFRPAAGVPPGAPVEERFQ